jgi:hypothetical protein
MWVRFVCWVRRDSSVFLVVRVIGGLGAEGMVV